VKRSLLLLAVLAPTAVTTLVPGPAAAAPEAVDASALALAIAADPSTVVSAEYLNPASSIGTTASSPAVRADLPLAGFPRAGTTYAVLSSGHAAGLLTGVATDGEVLGQDDGPGLHGSWNKDTTVLRVDVDVPEGSNCASVDLRFFSDEDTDFYPEAFFLERDLTTWSATGETSVSAPDNVATGPSGSLLTVNSPLVTTTVPAGTARDRASGVLTASASITPGPHSLFMSVYDQADSLKNTDVLLDDLRFGQVADPGSQCVQGLAPAISNVARPVVQGGAASGSTLTATPGTWSTTGALGFTYQWLRDGAPVQGATAKTYAVTAADVGRALSVRVTAANGGSRAATSAPTAPVTQPSAVTVLEELRTAQPTVKGKARVGRTLTARPGAWGPGTVTFAYQWFRGEKAVRGARSATYRVTRKDRGRSLHVVVTGSQPGFVTVTRTSPSTKQVRGG